MGNPEANPTDESEAHPTDESEADEGTPEDPTPDEDAEDDFGPPFVPKTFGGAFVWARGDGFTCTVLRVKEGKSVPVATQKRRDMHVMLTGGRAVLEVDDGTEVDQVELMPAAPVAIDPQYTYRLVALTEVELFTVFSPLPAA
jgi:mannose-6-phosphate isomerase-like protein (cupin superfamily)